MALPLGWGSVLSILVLVGSGQRLGLAAENADDARLKLKGALLEVERDAAERRRLRELARNASRTSPGGAAPSGNGHGESGKADLLLEAYQALLKSKTSELADETFRQARTDQAAGRYLAAWDWFSFVVKLGHGPKPTLDGARRALEADIPRAMEGKISAMPAGPRAFYEQGWKAFRAGRWAEALAAWERYRESAQEERGEEAALREVGELEGRVRPRAELGSRTAVEERMKTGLKAVDLSPSGGVRLVLEPLLYEIDRLKPEGAERVRAGLRWAHQQAQLERSIEEARASFDQGQPLRGLDQMTAVLLRDPDNKQAQGLLKMAELLRTQADPSPSGAWAKAEPSVAQRTSQAHYFRGLAYYKDQKRESASEAWEKALDLDPGNTLARKSLEQVRKELEGARMRKP